MKSCTIHKTDFTGIHVYEKSSTLPADWDRLLPEGHFLESAHLSVYEKMSIPDVGFLYVAVYEKDRLAACAYFQVFSIKEKHLSPARLTPLQARAWTLFTALGSPRLLVAGHLFRHDICSFYCDPTYSAYESFRFYQASIKKALRHSSAHAALVKDVAEELTTYFKNYEPKYLLLRNDISMEMDIPESWESVTHYEKSLKHKYAQRFRKVRQSWEALEIKELTVAETEQQKLPIFELYQQVSQRQQVRLGVLSPDFLPQLKAANPDTLHIWMAYENGTPVAFFSAWEHEELFDMFYIGFDYSRNDQYQLYFNILFFSIEQAVGFRKKKLVLGRTALEAKARAGCRPKYLSTFLYIRNPLIRTVMMQLQQNISSDEGEWENRHPFKG